MSADFNLKARRYEKLCSYVMLKVFCLSISKWLHLNLSQNRSLMEFAMKGNCSSRAIHLLICVTLLFTSYSGIAQCQSVTVQNVVATSLSSSTTALTWSDNYSGTLSIEWGVCGFTPGTGYYTSSATDSVILDRLNPGVDYDVYISCSTTHLTMISFNSGCQFAGNDISTAEKIDFDIPQWNWGTPDPLRRFRHSIISTNGCYSNALSYKPQADIVYLYEPHHYAQSFSISSSGAHDSASIRILDSTLNVIAVSDTCFPAVGSKKFGASLVDFQVDYKMKYYVAIELRSQGANPTCDSQTVCYFEENLIDCTVADMTELDTLATACNSIVLYWHQHDVDTFDISYGPVGTLPSNGAMIATQDTIVGLTNLMSGTSYDFYFKSSCSRDSASLTSWIGPFTYSTRGGVATATANVFSVIDSTTATDWYVTFDGTNSVADSLVWNFGDGSPNESGFLVSHMYTQFTTYTVIAFASQNCSVDTAMIILTVNPWSMSESKSQELVIVPQPVLDFAYIPIEYGEVQRALVFDLVGRKVVESVRFEEVEDGVRLDMSDLDSGTYILIVHTKRGVLRAKLIVQ